METGENCTLFYKKSQIAPKKKKLERMPFLYKVQPDNPISDLRSIETLELGLPGQCVLMGLIQV